MIKIRDYIKKHPDSVLTSLFLALLMICGLYVRIHGLSEWYWGPDDAWHLSFTTYASYHEMIQHILSDEVHPPGFFILLRAMTQMSDDPLFIRSISIFPGILLVISFYLVGKEAIGRAAGLFMAYIAAFNGELVILSQVVRQYSLFLLFISLAFWLLLKYYKAMNLKYIYLYTTVMLLSMTMHYMTIACIFTYGIVFGYILYCINKRHWLIWVGANSCLALFFALFYITQFYHNQEHATDAYFMVNEWLRESGFPIKCKEWFESFFLILFTDFISFDNNIAVCICSLLWLVAGSYLIIRDKNGLILAVILLILGLNILLSILNLYPFEMGRHSIFLMPFFLLIAAIGFQKNYEFLSQCIGKRGSEFLLLCLLVSTHDIHKIDSYRNYNSDLAKENYDVIGNFSFTSNDAASVLQYIFSHTEKNDIIITDKITINQLNYIRKNNVYEHISQNVDYVRYKERNFYFLHENPITVMFGHIYQLQEFLMQISHCRPEVKNKKIWFVTIGWGSLISDLNVPDLILRRPYAGEREEKNREFYDEYKAVYNLRWKFALSPEVQDHYTLGFPNGGVAVFSTHWDFLERTLLNSNTLQAFNKFKEERKKSDITIRDKFWWN